MQAHSMTVAAANFVQGPMFEALQTPDLANQVNVNDLCSELWSIVQQEVVAHAGSCEGDFCAGIRPDGSRFDAQWLKNQDGSQQCIYGSKLSVAAELPSSLDLLVSFSEAAGDQRELEARLSVETEAMTTPQGQVPPVKFVGVSDLKEKMEFETAIEDQVTRMICNGRKGGFDCYQETPFPASLVGLVTGVNSYSVDLYTEKNDHRSRITVVGKSPLDGEQVMSLEANLSAAYGDTHGSLEFRIADLFQLHCDGAQGATGSTDRCFVRELMNGDEGPLGKTLARVDRDREIDGTDRVFAEVDLDGVTAKYSAERESNGAVEHEISFKWRTDQEIVDFESTLDNADNATDLRVEETRVQDEQSSFQEEL